VPQSREGLNAAFVPEKPLRAFRFEAKVLVLVNLVAGPPELVAAHRGWVLGQCRDRKTGQQCARDRRHEEVVGLRTLRTLRTFTSENKNFPILLSHT